MAAWDEEKASCGRTLRKGGTGGRLVTTPKRWSPIGSETTATLEVYLEGSLKRCRRFESNG
jgi:hypothetical protein